jgi:hypothetical protein
MFSIVSEEDFKNIIHFNDYVKIKNILCEIYKSTTTTLMVWTDYKIEGDSVTCEICKKNFDVTNVEASDFCRLHLYLHYLKSKHLLPFI